MASKSEIARIHHDIRLRWPHGDIPGLERYDQPLAPFPTHQLQAVIDSMDRDGQKFAPRPTEIVAKLAKAFVDAPDWYAVLAELRDRQAGGGLRAVVAGRTCTAGGQCDGSGFVELDHEDNPIPVDSGIRPASSRRCQCHDQLLREAAQQRSTHPVVGMFLTRIDQREIADVLNGDRTAEAQMRTKYQQYVENLHRTLTHVGVDTADLAQFERLAGERPAVLEQLAAGRERAGELKRPDMAGQLTTSDEERAA